MSRRQMARIQHAALPARLESKRAPPPSRRRGNIRRKSAENCEPRSQPPNSRCPGKSTIGKPQGETPDAKKIRTGDSSSAKYTNETSRRAKLGPLVDGGEIPSAGRIVSSIKWMRRLRRYASPKVLHTDDGANTPASIPHWVTTKRPGDIEFSNMDLVSVEIPVSGAKCDYEFHFPTF